MSLPLAFSCSLNVQKNITVDQCLVPSNYIHSLHVQNHHQYESVPLPSLHSFNVQQTIKQFLVPSNYIHSLHVQNHHQYKSVLPPSRHSFNVQQTDYRAMPLPHSLHVQNHHQYKSVLLPSRHSFNVQQAIDQCLFPSTYIHSLHVQNDQYNYIYNILLLSNKISLYIYQ